MASKQSAVTKAAKSGVNGVLDLMTARAAGDPALAALCFTQLLRMPLDDVSAPYVTRCSSSSDILEARLRVLMAV